jgi:SAM-dependent methyltransferase
MIPATRKAQRVLEVGSWSACGGGYRHLFPQADYIGIDVSEGSGVDCVCSGEDAQFPTNSFDIVLSTECFEHNRYWRETLANMIRMCAPGGAVIITCAGLARPEHGTSRTSISASLTALALGDDYYSNLSPSDFKKTGLLGQLPLHIFAENREMCDLYFVGLKAKSEPLPSFLKRQLDQIKDEAARICVNPWRGFLFEGISRLRYHSLRVLAVTLGERKYHAFRLLHQRSGISLRRPAGFLELILKSNQQSLQ